MRASLLILILLLQLFASTDVFADNTSGEINAIKRDAANYIYAESTMPTESEARSNADNLLVTNITSYLEETHPDVQFSPIMARKFKYMKMMRGNDVRIFAYIAKSSLTELNSEAASESGNEAECTETAATTPPDTGVKLSSDQKQVVDNLLRCNDMVKALKLLALFQSSQLIEDYGTRTSLPSGIAPYWIVSDADNQLSTVITPQPEYIDLKTGEKIPNNTIIEKAVYWFVMP